MAHAQNADSSVQTHLEEFSLTLLRSVLPPPVATCEKRKPRRSPGSIVTCARNSSALSSVSIRNILPPLSFGSCKNSNTTYKIQQYE
ncbi:hypothetical protein TNCT_514751 [Trichonephila clavata]|uniref:Uncharacterized protein n=1 Tax=Trichonephila clavata TaxID=2740835 RepID=A0A8X6F3B3_TRICU|nr:hypothetical protein TNCT_514751 [Trichonephila clavata]